MKARAPPPPCFTRGNGSSCPRPLQHATLVLLACVLPAIASSPRASARRRPDGAGHAGEGPRRPGRSRVLGGVPSHARRRHLPRDDHAVQSAPGVDQQGLQHRRDVPALAEGEPGTRADAGRRHGQRVHRHRDQAGCPRSRAADTNPCSLLVSRTPPEGIDHEHLPTAYATVKLDFRQNAADCPPPVASMSGWRPSHRRPRRSTSGPPGSAGVPTRSPST